MNSKRFFQLALLGVGGYIIYKKFFAKAATKPPTGASTSAPEPTFSLNPADFLPGGRFYKPGYGAADGTGIPGVNPYQQDDGYDGVSTGAIYATGA